MRDFSQGEYIAGVWLPYGFTPRGGDGADDPKTRAELEDVKRLEDHLVGRLTQAATDIQKSLDDAMKKGTHPAQTLVADLEKRLADAEIEIASKIQKYSEELRLSQSELINMGIQPGVKRAPNFHGAFIHDLEVWRKTIRSLSQATPSQTRAIDSALLSAGGALGIEVADAFIDFLIEEQTTLNRITVRRMGSNQGAIDEMRIAARKMIAASEATLPASLGDAITTKRRILTTVEVIWAEDITLTFLEDNIERADAEVRIARLLATQFGNDSNDLGWNGESTTAPFLIINDGWLKLAGADAEVNDYDATSGGAGDNDTTVLVMSGMWGKVPSNFLGQTDYIFFCPIGFGQNYANEVSARETQLGDDILINGFPSLRYFGRPVVPDAHLQADEIFLTPARNLVYGIQRNITIDNEWVPRKRVVEYTLTARTDYEYATGKAIVLGDNVDASLL